MRELKLSLKWSGKLILEVGIAVLIGITISFVTTSYGIIFNYLSAFINNYFSAGLSRLLLIIIIPLALFSYILIKHSSFNRGSLLENFLLLYHFRGGYITFKDLLLLLIASLITVSIGGSVGVAGVAVFTGYVIARIITRRLSFIRNTRYFSIIGAVAGISAVFRAPLAGMAFSLEMPFKRGIEVSYILPSLAASISAYIVSKTVFGGTELLLFMRPKTVTYDLQIIVHSLAIGIISVLLTLFAYTFKFALRKVKNIMSNYNEYLVPLTLSLIIIGVSYLNPLALGSGYALIPSLPSLKPYTVLASLLILKLTLTLLTLELGGAGGVFIPLLIVGASLGALYGELLSLRYVDLLIMAGIAGIFSATNKVLLTSILLAAEAGGLAAVVPASISSIIAYTLTIYTSIHFLQPPIGHGTIRARVSRLMTVMCEDGIKYLSTLRSSEGAGPACIVSPHDRVFDVIIKCRNYRHVLIKSKPLKHVTLHALSTQSRYDEAVSVMGDVVSILDGDEPLIKVLEELLYGGVEAVVIREGNEVKGVASIERIEEFLRRVLISKCLGTSEE